MAAPISSSANLVALYLLLLVSTNARPGWSMCPGSQGPCKISTNMYDWSRAKDLIGPNNTRFWTRDDLDVTIDGRSASRAHPLHVKAFFDKLEAGKKIVSVGIGSSLIYDYAGCFQSSYEALWQEGCIPNPMMYQQMEGLTSTKHSAQTDIRCGAGNGFMEGVMTTINETFPNKGHIFFNNGKGGSCLDHIVRGDCFEAYVPKEVDLVILDTVTNICDSGAAEKLVRYFLLRPNPPLVVFLSNTRHCLGNFSSFQRAQCGDCLVGEEECVRKKIKWPGSNCGQYLNGSFHSRNSHLLFAAHHIAPYADIAKRYQVAHINLHKIMGKFLFQTPTTWSRLNISAAAMTQLLYRDYLHFRRERAGTLLVSDVIINWLVREKESLDVIMATQEHQAALSYKMPQPGNTASQMWTYQRCYGLNLAEIINTLNQSSKSEGVETVLDKFKNGNIGELFNFGALSKFGGRQQFLALPSLKVLSMSKWDLQVFYKGRTGNKFKPGFVTRQSGAVLEFEVDTFFPERANANEAGPVEVVISHTQSYDGWGIAEVICISGCTCAPSKIDAHKEERTSLIELHRVAVSEHKACGLQLTIQAESSSGEFKFKVSSVGVQYEASLVRDA